MDANSDNPRQSSGSEQPKNVQGTGNVLSNFYPFTFNYKGRRFGSPEHAYQNEKAMFLGDNELAKKVFYS